MRNFFRYYFTRFILCLIEFNTMRLELSCVPLDTDNFAVSCVATIDIEDANATYSISFLKYSSKIPTSVLVYSDLLYI